MKRFILFVAVILFLNGCINTKPFRVGDNVDAIWQIKNLDETKEKFSTLAKSMCLYVNNSKVAIVDFIDDNSHYIDSNGKYLSFLLTEDLNKLCKTTAYYEGLPLWFDYKKLKLSKYPEKYEFAIVGDYLYSDHCYSVFVRLIDLKEGVLLKDFDFSIGRKGVDFSVEPLSIPNDVEFP
ncbi:hypothetical protein [Hippea maritima]|uniref:Uncharacterized protein n=1 Tax=Hippea maritima (strain ATCC 700847 / DSM 10411 / MH2) TaxID=760142 RepID=F2LXX5_HIPMA|nr:hypothetical protein [Hippea maritima]AEA33240.1 hypothetical protein Hipma_0263 [Hippea maritima DSM 10411]